METLKIIPKQSTFYIDDFIEGQVELFTPAQLILSDITVTLNLAEKWITYSKEIKLNIVEGKTTPLIMQNLNVKEQLNIYTNLAVVKPGTYLFPFKFKSPQLLAPSFEFPGKGDKAYIRYYLTSNIISPYTKTTTSIYILLKTRQRIEMNKQVILTTETNIHKFGMFGGGRTKLKVTSLNGTDNFKFGEDINFDIAIDNTNGKIGTTECKIVLSRNVKFMNHFGQIKRDITDKLSSIKVKTESTAGEYKNFPCVFSLKNIQNDNFVIPGSDIPYNNFTDINYFLPSFKEIILECSYSLKFTLYFKNFVKFNERPRIIFNIIICHQSLDEGKDEIAQILNLNMNNTMPNMQNNVLPPPPANIVIPNMDQSTNIYSPIPNMMPQINNLDFQNSDSTPLGNHKPPQQLNSMMNNNNMNNNQNNKEELSSMDKIESSQLINNNDINNEIENSQLINNNGINNNNNNNNNGTFISGSINDN